MLNSQRQIRTPTSAISPATTAVATPPDHNIRASTTGRARRGWAYAGWSGGYGRLPGVPGSIGTVMVSRPSVRLAAPSAAVVLSSPRDVVPNTHARRRGSPGAWRPGSGPGQNDFQGPGAVHALDAVEFDVAGGGGTADPGAGPAGFQALQGL